MQSPPRRTSCTVYFSIIPLRPTKGHNYYFSQMERIVPPGTFHVPYWKGETKYFLKSNTFIIFGTLCTSWQIRDKKVLKMWSSNLLKMSVYSPLLSALLKTNCLAVLYNLDSKVIKVMSTVCFVNHKIKKSFSCHVIYRTCQLQLAPPIWHKLYQMDLASMMIHTRTSSTTFWT